MLTLIISTIVTSAADSLNPIAITQQFALQGMVKKPRHIWYFIISIAITNLISGFLAYFGLIAPISNFIRWVLGQYGFIVFTIELILGIGIMTAMGYSIRKTRNLRQKDQEDNKEDDKNTTTSIKSVTPLSLTLLGIVATISELTTALPYFAFLAILSNYQLSIISVTTILLLYNIIYSLPLIILYLVYIKARDKFDGFYSFIKYKMKAVATALVPIVIGIIGFLLIFHSSSNLLNLLF